MICIVQTFSIFRLFSFYVVRCSLLNVYNFVFLCLVYNLYKRFLYERFLFLLGGHGRSIGNVLYLHNSPYLWRVFKTSIIVTTLASMQHLECFAGNRYLYDISRMSTMSFTGRFFIRAQSRGCAWTILLVADIFRSNFRVRLVAPTIIVLYELCFACIYFVFAL